MNPLFMENWHMQCTAHDIIYGVFCRVLVIITELFIIDLIWNVNEFKSSLLKCKNNHKNLLFSGNSSLTEANGNVPTNVKKYWIYLIHLNVGP